ncbi:hypothetical protein Spb1_03750 [Planctopirus ephydatiae]|uniref:Uncharacterized protein n=1 Tax=Planctopirus ephydatiae TaxID=2528019 RepID=A0A518GIV2_9PLAN|nr:hypothetical protein Spb1_03750 [Planctopirus ephydatiae]
MQTLFWRILRFPPYGNAFLDDDKRELHLTVTGQSNKVFLIELKKS